MANLSAGDANHALVRAFDETSNSFNVTLNGSANGTSTSIAVTQDGHMETKIHGTLPFGSVHTEQLHAVFQADAVYGLDSSIAGRMQSRTSGTGSVTVVDSTFNISTGATIYSQGVLQSRARIKYRAGQGIICRFTSAYTAPVASSYQIAGIGHAEDGVYIGYKDTDFGILYVNRGVRAQHTLTITTASTTNENVTVKLNDTNYSVAVTNSGNIQRTVYEIANGTYSGWRAEAIGATIVFLSDSVGAKSGAFTLTATTAVGGFATTKTGVASTDLFIPQSSFNGDKLDGTGVSGFTIDKTKLNVFQIGLQYLGAGIITFKVETVDTDKNDAEWTIFHTMKLPNTLSVTTFGNPSMPFTAAAYSAGSTTNLTVKVGSVGLFTEGNGGDKSANRYTYYNTSTGVGAASYLPLYTIKNAYTFANRSNQSVIRFTSISGAIKHTSPVSVFIFRGATLTGNPNFSRYASGSCALYDTSATACTISTNDQIVFSTSMGDTGDFLFEFAEEFVLQPGEYITVAARSLSGTPSFVVVSLNSKEEL